MATTNSISRTVRLCKWKARVNSLWMWAYSILALVLQAYLLYRAVTRCKQYNELSWRTEDKPVVELYIYISLIVLSVMCVPFFIITSVFKVNNFAGDGVRLGRDNIHEDELAEAASAISLSDPSVNGSTNNIRPDFPDDDITVESRREDVTSHKTLGSCLQTAWRHIGPFSQGFHVVSAFALLLPSFLLEAQEIKYGFQNPDASWSSELDILFGRRDWKNKPVEDTSVVRYNQGDVTTTATSRPITFPVAASPPISPEYVNYVIALVVYAVRYAAVFWYTKMSFSFVFIAEMCIITVHFAFSFCGAAVLYKFQVNSHGFSDLNLALPARVTLILFLLGNAFLLLSTSAIFSYGFQHYSERWGNFLKTYAPVYFQNNKSRLQCQGYSPHIMATVLLLLVICCRGAIVYDYVSVYRKTGFPVILGCIVMDAIYMVSWIALWFALTLKHTWNFRIMFARYIITSPAIGSSEGQQSGKRNHNASSTNQIGSQNDCTSQHVPNGHSAVASVETTDGTEPKGTVSGDMKKINNRKSISSQKVKFDKSADENPKSGKNARKPKLRKEHGGDDNPEDYVTESTPENTLTRKYRHSIRDKCGQYYRISKETTPPPAAQSSPRVNNTRQNKNNPTADDRIVLNPLEADKQYPNCPPYLSGPSKPSRDDGARTGSHGFAPDGVPLRYPAVHPREPNPARQADTRYSFPLTSSAGNWGHGPHDSVHNTPQKYKGNRPEQSMDPRLIRHSLQLEHPTTLPSVHEGSYLLNNNKLSGSLQDQRSPQHRELSTSQKSRGSDIYNHDPPRPSTPPRPPRQRSSGRASRGTRLGSNKPDLSNRDSALPSSNETSSNDSNDVLCSQV